MPPLQARIIGRAEQYEQLPLPEVKTDHKPETLKISRTRQAKQVRELVYEPYEHSP